MKTRYYTASTLDGFIATDDDSLDWLFALGDPETSSYEAFIAQIGVIVMGSSTYRWLLAHSEAVVAQTGSAWPYAQPTFVFTTQSLPRVDGADVRFVSGDVRPVYGRMLEACGGRDAWLVGGGDLVGQFLDAGLLDELTVQIGSAVLGSGKALLPRTVLPPTLHLRSVTQPGTEFVELIYDVRRPSV